MGMIIAAIVAIIVSMFGRLFADEFKSFRPKIVEYFVLRAAQKLPEGMRERYLEEWRGYLADIPGDLAQIFAALSFGLVAGRISSPYSPWEQYSKRFTDVFVSVICLILLLPLLIVIALIVWSYDRKSPFYAHRRLGRHGVPFWCLKFRSMYVDGDRLIPEYLPLNVAAREDWILQRNLENDPRFTPVGRVLRKTSLDELPQLINIIRGDMSLIGPRPLAEAEVDKFGEEFSKCFSVRPGLTGAWQVSDRDETTYDDRVKQDLDYVERWSLWRYFVILLKTIPAVFIRKGKNDE